MSVPSATYRLQLGERMRFRDALELVPYLDRLGISDLYLSPILSSASEHGYDVVDPTRLDRRLGSETDLRALSVSLRDRGMGMVVDIVPNHMAAVADNPWWWDLLRLGPSSRYARWFDVDWRAGEGKVLLPVLGEPYGEAVRGGRLRVEQGPDGGILRYADLRFPLAPRTGPARSSADRRVVDAVARAQHYRLAHWPLASAEINYRRFFDLSDKVGVRQEEPEAFEATHALVLRLLREGVITGLRVDHVDGLWDPLAYLGRLREAAGEAYVVVEKILGPEERLPGEWPVHGSTGYELGADLDRLLVDAEGLEEVRRVAADHGGPAQRRSFVEVARSAKREVLRTLFVSEVERLACAIWGRAREEGADVARPDVAAALVETTAQLDVYRTYLDGHRHRPTDRRTVESAARRAASSVPVRARPAAELVRGVLLLDGARIDPAIVMRWQQLSGPAAAKGVEDTALYRHVPLVSLNEVGSDPEAGALDPSGFHARLLERARRWPEAMAATSTHDSKRGEDIRARVAVLSELPDEWERALVRWRRWNASLRRDLGDHEAPDADEELLLYQTILGVWPADAEPAPDLARRIEKSLLKAAREAKSHTSWLEPNTRHEDALRRFVRSVLGREGQRFRRDVARLARRVAFHGALNALAMTVLKIAAPGVPDMFQGTELWHLRLVDPDNRAPVDFARRRDVLGALDLEPGAPLGDDARRLLRSWPDGRIKMLVAARALRFRREHRELFLRGRYVPLEVRGPLERHVVAFARRRRSDWAIVAAPRLTAAVAPAPTMPLGDAWGRTALLLPEGAPPVWSDILSGERVTAGRGGLRCASLFARLPVALLAAERLRRPAPRTRRSPE